jgi:hypothetical protein
MLPKAGLGVLKQTLLQLADGWVNSGLVQRQEDHDSVCLCSGDKGKTGISEGKKKMLTEFRLIFQSDGRAFTFSAHVKPY